MNNIEWLKHNNDILERCLLDRWGVSDGMPQPCLELDCDNCDFASNFSCHMGRKSWFRQEYKSRFHKGDVVLTDRGEIRMILSVEDGNIKVSDNSHASLGHTAKIQESEIQRVLANIFE